MEEGNKEEEIYSDESDHEGKSPLIMRRKRKTDQSSERVSNGRKNWCWPTREQIMVLDYNSEYIFFSRMKKRDFKKMGR